MASPPNCAYCNAANVTVVNQYFDGELRDKSIVMLSCNHANVVQNGQWVRLNTAASTATTTEQNAFEQSGKTKITTNMITALKKYLRHG